MNIFISTIFNFFVLSRLLPVVFVMKYTFNNLVGLFPVFLYVVVLVSFAKEKSDLERYIYYTFVC